MFLQQQLDLSPLMQPLVTFKAEQRTSSPSYVTDDDSGVDDDSGDDDSGVDADSGDEWDVMDDYEPEENYSEHMFLLPATVTFDQYMERTSPGRWSCSREEELPPASKSEFVSCSTATDSLVFGVLGLGCFGGVVLDHNTPHTSQLSEMSPAPVFAATSVSSGSYGPECEPALDWSRSVLAAADAAFDAAQSVAVVTDSDVDTNDDHRKFVGSLLLDDRDDFY